MAKKRQTEGGKRRCSRCQKLKARAEFPRNAATADGLALYCRPCKRDADRGRARKPAEHPPPAKLGVDRNPDEPTAAVVPRRRAPALAITEELIDQAAELIRSCGMTRRATARACGVSENTFKGWLREGAEEKNQDDPRARLLFAVEQAEGEAEAALTRSYWESTKVDGQQAQRFLERRFSKGDEKWARTEHLEVSDGDRAPMEMADARKLLADKLGKLLTARAAAGIAPSDVGGDSGHGPGGPAEGPAAAGEPGGTGPAAAEPA